MDLISLLSIGFLIRLICSICGTLLAIWVAGFMVFMVAITNSAPGKCSGLTCREKMIILYISIARRMLN